MREQKEKTVRERIIVSGATVNKEVSIRLELDLLTQTLAEAEREGTEQEQRLLGLTSEHRDLEVTH